MEVRSIEAIVKALNRARVKYLIVGGLADIADLERIEELKKEFSRGYTERHK